ncbi:MAG TPA: ElyC/SanA/YdcF family protein [Terriglobales bacterium]|nr:ElyC/SanA/YdcF family protein [Terriglobales bacterium]
MLSDYLVINQPLQPSDVIFVLAGRPERKSYGLRLYREGLAPRLLLSVGRYEVRQPGHLGLVRGPDVVALARATPTHQRHFFIDMRDGREEVLLAELTSRGTFPELCGFARYISAARVRRITLISTGIHLRRVRYCCDRIAFFADKQLNYVAVPDELSSFRDDWWKHRRGWRYVTSEYAKLVGYCFKYRRA